ncbi:hypothetical protein A0H76_2760 [Hepatospora eriocheir]|uniref:Uncharacterized protein n=1 Tax=Hepatospora eriocheir TaxID=1081669 RepID=A0A1X0QJE1_9MICR|nr:hypothetical protein A0H76_2760 [Hepatospora eriocheir]
MIVYQKVDDVKINNKLLFKVESILFLDRIVTEVELLKIFKFKMFENKQSLIDLDFKCLIVYKDGLINDEVLSYKDLFNFVEVFDKSNGFLSYSNLGPQNYLF